MPQLVIVILYAILIAFICVLSHPLQLVKLLFFFVISQLKLSAHTKIRLLTACLKSARQYMLPWYNSSIKSFPLTILWYKTLKNVKTNVHAKYRRTLYPKQDYFGRIAQRCDVCWERFLDPQAILLLFIIGRCYTLPAPNGKIFHSSIYS